MGENRADRDARCKLRILRGVTNINDPSSSSVAAGTDLHDQLTPGSVLEQDRVCCRLRTRRPISRSRG
jgi:hypothetical protein